MAEPDICTMVRVRKLARTGEALRLRRAAQVSRCEMARAVQVCNQTIYNWEHGVRTPQGEAAARYLAILDDISSLLTGTSAESAVS